MNRNTRAYEVIADRIIAALDGGTVPWRKPWSLPAGIRPQSVAGHAYSGVNAVVLGLSGYCDPRWLTYRKATELGGHVKRGEKGTPIVFVTPLTVERENEDGQTEEKTIRFLRYYHVFNVEQCEGLPLPQVGTPEPFDPIAAAERIIANMPEPPPISHNGGNKAYYTPAADSVHLPPRGAFSNAGEYYSTAFHELGHSTGHRNRLDRHGLETGIAPFGSAVYSREELAAEFCAAFLCAQSGIQNTIDNSAAYIQGWAKAINRDKRLVVIAASQGQKAADYILGRQADGQAA